MRCPTCGAVRSDGGQDCDHGADDARLGSMVGNYRLASVLGRGGMGTVYRGEHAYLDRSVAVKVLRDEYLRDPEHTAQFLREAQAASRIRHPNIVDVMDFGELGGGGVYFLMELIDGTALDTLIANAAPLTALRTITIVNQIARALDAVHSHGIVHGDLKPENVLLQEKKSNRQVIRVVDGRQVVEPEGTFDYVKLLDFGTARLIAAIQQSAPAAGTRIMGTPWYMAPEVIRSQPHDHRVDIYACGIMLYEMLTGCLPFDDDTAMGILKQQIYAEPVPPREIVDWQQLSQITEPMERLILKAIAKDPAARFATMEELRKELLTCYADARFADPGPRVREEREKSEVERRRAIDPPGPVPTSPTVEDKLTSLFGAWSKNVAKRSPTGSTPALRTAPLAPVLDPPPQRPVAKPSAPNVPPPTPGGTTLPGYARLRKPE